MQGGRDLVLIPASPFIRRIPLGKALNLLNLSVSLENSNGFTQVPDFLCKTKEHQDRHNASCFAEEENEASPPTLPILPPPT